MVAAAIIINTFAVIFIVNEIAFVTGTAAKINGPVYLRLSRMETPIIYDDNQKFEIGKAIQIGEGQDATIITTGDVVYEALKAKEELEKKAFNTVWSKTNW